MSKDLPFRLRGGESYQCNITNRISAIDRMEFLLKKKYSKEFSFRHAGETWLHLWDLEMYQKWYKDEPKDHRIDEQFCQRGAEVARDMIASDLKIEETGADITAQVKETFKQHIAVPNEVEPKKPWWHSITRRKK